jgi:hypothetical protein
MAPILSYYNYVSDIFLRENHSRRITNTKTKKTKTKLHGLSPRAYYTDRATADCRRSDCQLLRIEDATWSAWRIPTNNHYSQRNSEDPIWIVCIGYTGKFRQVIIFL